MNQSASSEVAALAGGCCWLIEAGLLEVDGVENVISGYTGGTTVNPTYREVCTNNTSHEEAVQVTFDSTRISTQHASEV